jgi:hypothetical protein
MFVDIGPKRVIVEILEATVVWMDACHVCHVCHVCYVCHTVDEVLYDEYFDSELINCSSYVNLVCIRRKAKAKDRRGITSLA